MRTVLLTSRIMLPPDLIQVCSHIVLYARAGDPVACQMILDPHDPSVSASITSGDDGHCSQQHLEGHRVPTAALCRRLLGWGEVIAFVCYNGMHFCGFYLVNRPAMLG